MIKHKKPLSHTFLRQGLTLLVLALPGTHYVDLEALNLRDPPAPAFRVLGLIRHVLPGLADIVSTFKILKSLSKAVQGGKMARGECTYGQFLNLM